MKKLVLALAAVAMIATPALADYSFYGSARVATFYVDDSSVSQNNLTGVTTEADSSSFNVRLQGNSRFGLKASTGDVSGRIEYGTGVNLRLLYGEVKLGAGTLLIGQTYTPYTKFSNQALNDDLGFIGFGALYDGRTPQIKYTTDMGLYMAAIQNKGGLGNVADVWANNGVTTDDIIIPKLVVGYAGAAGDFKYNAGVAYQKFSITDGVTDEDVNSYLVYLCGDAKLGDASFIYGVHYGTNLSNFGLSGRNSDYTSDDATSFGGMLEVDIAGFAAGIGYVSDELDIAADADTQMTYFVNYTLQVAKGFKIVPEFTYIDYMDDTLISDGSTFDGGNMYGVGAKLQMDF